MPRARWRDWFLGSIGVGKPVKPMAEPMTKPVEGQIGITGQIWKQCLKRNTCVATIGYNTYVEDGAMQTQLLRRLRELKDQWALEKWSETELLNALISAHANPHFLNCLLSSYARVLGTRAIRAIETAILMDTRGAITPETLATITETLIAHEHLSEETPLDSSPTLTMLKKIFERRILPFSLREEALRLYVQHASQYLGIKRSTIDGFQSYLLRNLASDTKTTRIVRRVIDEYILKSNVYQKNRLIVTFSKCLFVYKKISTLNMPENSLELCFSIHDVMGRHQYDAYAALRLSEEVLQWMKSRVMEHLNIGSILFEEPVTYFINNLITSGEMWLLSEVHNETRQLRKGR